MIASLEILFGLLEGKKWQDPKLPCLALESFLQHYDNNDTIARTLPRQLQSNLGLMPKKKGPPPLSGIAANIKDPGVRVPSFDWRLAFSQTPLLRSHAPNARHEKKKKKPPSAISGTTVLHLSRTSSFFFCAMLLMVKNPPPISLLFFSPGIHFPFHRLSLRILASSFFPPLRAAPLFAPSLHHVR